MSEETTMPKPRPKNLPKLKEFPTELPIPVPETGTDAATLEWCERLRDHFEERGQSVGPKGLLKFVGLMGLDTEDEAETKKQVKKLYKVEFAEAAKGTSPKAKKPEKKGKKNVTATKEKKTAKNGNGKKAVKAKPSKNGSDESSTVYEGTVKGLPVCVQQTAGGNFRVSVAGYAIRKLMAFLGKAGWGTAEVKETFCKLLRGWKKGEGYVAEVVAEGHCGSGAKANKAGKYAFGTLPAVEPAHARLLKALRK